MQIVIDIPEEKYNWLCNTEFSFKSKLNDAIKSGTPLPKGHGRLLDENEIKQMIEDAKVENYRSKDFAENIIRFAPTIIEADKGE